MTQACTAPLLASSTRSRKRRVYPIATHLESPERARALYLLTLGLDDLTPSERERLDELHELVLELLEQPEVTGLEARNLVERRRAEAMRIVHKDRMRRRAHRARATRISPGARAVRHRAASRALGTAPRRISARVSVLPLDQFEWRVEVAARDRPGLLATVSGVLADHGLDILDAVVATWPDGGALDSFRVRLAELEPTGLTSEELGRIAPPEPTTLEAGIVAALDMPLEALPNPDADVRFDDSSSPWYTLCEVRSPDRRGLLHSLTAGIASAGADVHSARLVTIAGQAVDRFELTDRNGRKLDEAARRVIVNAIHDGVTPRRRLLGRRR